MLHCSTTSVHVQGCVLLHTSVLAVVSCVPTGTLTVGIGRRTMACSSVLTGWTTDCNRCKSQSMIQRSLAAWMGAPSYMYVCMYLIPGSSLLCTHWDSHSKHWKMNDGMFLHSDRLDYSLQIGNIHTYVHKSMLHDIVEAPCYFVDIGRTDHEQIRSRINNNDYRTFLL